MSSPAGVGHLSIGEVLSLVQEDFPDVTISKIRFLESQGLIAPERTAAGYRKFYDSDIERLRWILRQQRDHFLPLKVIRKMLDQGVDVSPDSEAQPTLWSAAASGPTAGEHSRDDDVDDATATNGAAGDRGDHEGVDPADEPAIDVTDSSRRLAADAAPDPARHRASAEHHDDEQERSSYRSPAHPAVASAQPRAARPGAASADSDQGGDRHGSGDRPGGEDTAAGGAGTGRVEERSPDDVEDGPVPVDPEPAAPPRAAYSTPADVVAALQEEPRTRRRGPADADTAADAAAPPTTTDPGAPAPRAGSGPTPGDRAEVRLTGEELCDASGTTPEQLADLEQFGLIQPTVLGGDPQYDGTALEVARIAARYAEMGVGARHLRMYKVAAEREAGFIEQLVVPLLKQRNPSARTEAFERSEELQRMGAELHASLLRRRLGPDLGG